LDNDDEEEEEEVDEEANAAEGKKSRLKVRIDGKKKVHDVVLDADDSLKAVLDAVPGLEKEEEEDDVRITCVAKRLVVEQSNTDGMNKSLRDHGLFPTASLVVKVLSSGAATDKNKSGGLAERAAAKREKKTGTHTMQSIGIYAKDDNNKAELIDGGGGVWYEHDVTDDEEEEGDDAQQAEDDAVPPTQQQQQQQQPAGEKKDDRSVEDKAVSEN